ncbi:MAG TPA: glycosyltransferase [Acidimicrobiales bacterium]|nr:glycosyltransferase [Acidimicrobiales bacterium]
MARIRVIRIIARMNVGGPALQVTNLARGLDESRFEHRILTGFVGPDEADYLDLRASDVATIRIEGLGRAPNGLGDIRALREIRRHLAEFRPHIVHTHTAKAGALGRLAAFTSSTPVTVHTFHGHLLNGYFSRPLGAAVTGAERMLARRTTRLVAVGARVRDDLLAAGIGHREQYRVVAPGIDLPPAPPAEEARADLGIARDVPTVAWVARMTHVKRPDRFAEVARLIGQRRHDVKFLVAGQGQLLEGLRTATKPLGGRVKFLGWRSDVETIYAASDVVVLTSDNEGMPVSLIEASMAGRPCVTTDVGSAREVVDNGVTGIVTDTSVPALADAVCRLIEDPVLRRRMGEAAARRAADRFGASRLVQDTDEMYSELTHHLAVP